MVKGIDLSFQTTRCQRCNKLLKITSLTIFYKTDSQEQLRKVIGLMNASAEGKQNEFQAQLQQKRQAT